MASRKKTAVTEEAPALGPTTSNGGTSRKPRAPRRKAAVDRIPEEVTVDFHGVREQLQQSSASAQAAQQGAAELRDRVEEVTRRVETEANSAIVRINRARDQAEEAARLHKEAEQKARKAAREAEHALQAAREAGTRLRGLEEEHQAAWAQALEEIAEDIRLVRQRPAQRAPARAPNPTAASPAIPPRSVEPLAPAAVELVPDEPLKKGEAVVQASVRSESATERLTRMIQQLMAVKSSVADALGEAADGAFDHAVARPLRQQRAMTEEQNQELEQRLRDLGGEPEGGRGAFRRLLSWAFQGWGREPDDLDRTVQGVWKAMASQSLEMAMSQWLAPLARALGDPVTARLAERHWRQKEAAIAELRPFLVPLAELAARMSDVAGVVRRTLKVEVDVSPEEAAAPPAPAKGGAPPG